MSRNEKKSFCWDGMGLLSSVFWSEFRWRQSGGLVWSGECKLLVRQLWWPGQLGSSSHITAVTTARSEVDTVPAGMSVWPLDCNDITPLSSLSPGKYWHSHWWLAECADQWRGGLCWAMIRARDDGHQTRTRSELTFTRWRHNSTIRWIIGWNDES